MAEATRHNRSSSAWTATPNHNKAMSVSPHLAIPLLVQSQANKDVTINDMVQALARGRGYLIKSVAGTGVIQITSFDEARYGVIEFTGALTGNRTVELPTGIDLSLVVINSTTGNFTLSVRYTSGAAVVIPRGTAAPIRRDASNAAVFDHRGGNVRLPEFVVERITSAQSLTPATDTVIQFNNETLDPSESFDSATNWRFTAPATGLYEFHAQAEIEVTVAGTGNTNAQIAIRRNGSIVRRGDLIQGPAASTCLQRVSARALIALTLGDTVDVVARQDQTGATSRINQGSDRTFFFGRAIRLG